MYLSPGAMIAQYCLSSIPAENLLLIIDQWPAYHAQLLLQIIKFAREHTHHSLTVPVDHIRYVNRVYTPLLID